MCKRYEPEQKISFTSPEGEHCKAVILSCAGKKTGQNKHWYNVEYYHPENINKTQGSVDLSKVTNLQHAADEQNNDNYR